MHVSRCCFAAHWQGQSGIDTTGATHVNLTFFFRVGVDQDFALQPVWLQTKCTGHSAFFIDSQQHFQWTVLQIRRCDHRQRRSHTDTVVRAQCSALGFYPLTINIRTDRITGEVMLSVVVLLRHHVQMRLQHHRFTVFHAWRCWLTDQNVADLITLNVQILATRPLHNVVCQRFFVMRWVWNRADLFEKLPQRLW